DVRSDIVNPYSKRDEAIDETGTVIHREEYYLKNEEPKEGTAEYSKWQEAMEQAKGKAKVIIAKQRHGPTGIVPLTFQSDFTCFSDLEK
ncbi:DnaB-like helicase C-terminal domain-containing protein, partial [Bartonella vinsonii]|uniref:DnaB-like helicase C-terminal domain-containing protein n=1 Tax=Bartonella vinsonii TaxID=33047 RepID=UPI00055132A6